MGCAWRALRLCGVAEFLGACDWARWWYVVAFLERMCKIFPFGVDEKSVCSYSSAICDLRPGLLLICPNLSDAARAMNTLRSTPNRNISHIWLHFSTRCSAFGGGFRLHRRFQGGRGLSRACAGRMDTRDCVRGYPLLENRGQTRANRRYSVVERVGVGSSLSTDFFIAFSHNAMNWDYAVS